MRNALKATALALFASALVAGTAMAGPAPQTAAGDALDPRTYDPGSKLALVAHAMGVQKYTCQADGTWLFTDPEATLFKTTGAPKEMGSHFLNFATGRPVWMLNDGSSVEAARKAAGAGGAGNIPLLLLQAVANTRRSPRRHDVGAALEHLRRRRSGRNVHARRPCGRAVLRRLLLLDVRRLIETAGAA